MALDRVFINSGIVFCRKVILLPTTTSNPPPLPWCEQNTHLKNKKLAKHDTSGVVTFEVSTTRILATKHLPKQIEYLSRVVCKNT